MSEVMEAVPVSDAAPESMSEPQELSLGEIVRRAAAGETAEQITGAEPAEEGPARDEQGRFTSMSAKEGGTEEEVDADKPAPATEEPETPAITPPQAWSAAEKDVFASLPREAQEAIVRREKDVERAFQERAPRLKELDAIQEVLAPFAGRYRSQGFTDVDAVRMWGTVANELVRNPAATIAELMRQHGVTPEQLTGQPANPQTTQPSVDNVLARRLEQVENLLRQRDEQATLSRIEKFAADPKYPHFEAVRAQMGKLMAAGIVADGDLEAAYDAAIRIVPDVRDRIAAEERAAAEAKRLAEAKVKAEAARKATTAIRGAPPLSTGAVVPQGDGSVRSDLMAAIAALSNR